MSDTEPVEDPDTAAFLAHKAKQRAEADALLADPHVHTPTDQVDGDENLPAG